MAQAHVSVVVNNHNYGRYLAQAIDSALNQTFAQTEVIVVDDGSTDESRDVLSTYGSEIRVVLQENGGQAAALNAGFRSSRGELVIFLDADDYLYPSAVERVVAAWGSDVAKAHYRLDLLDSRGGAAAVVPALNSTDRFDCGNVVPLLLSRGTYEAPAMSGNAFARSVLQELMPIPAEKFRIIADGYLVNLAPFYGSVACIDEALGVYRIHGENRWNRPLCKPGARPGGALELDGERLRALVVHGAKVQALISARARERGFVPPRDLALQNWPHLRARLASQRLDPASHPIPSDGRVRLVLLGLRSLWRFSGLARREQAILSLWFLWIGLLPRRAARIGIAWVFAPQVLPPRLARLLVGLRALLLEGRIRV